MSRDMTKPTKWRKFGSLTTHWAHSEDSDQTGRMPRLIWIFAGCTLLLLVLSCRGSYGLNCWISLFTVLTYQVPYRDACNKITNYCLDPHLTQCCNYCLDPHLTQCCNYCLDPHLTQCCNYCLDPHLTQCCNYCLDPHLTQSCNYCLDPHLTQCCNYCLDPHLINTVIQADNISEKNWKESISICFL